MTGAAVAGLNVEVVAKWSMKPSPAGLSGVSSIAAAGALGGGGLTGAAVAAGDACGAAPSLSGVPVEKPKGSGLSCAKVSRDPTTRPPSGGT